MSVTLVTVPDVPIVSTGTYPLASGETTFSQEDLADAVHAARDATIPAPRLKIGHSDPRFAEAVASGELDGEPAFGTVQNLRLTEDGQTVLGDYVDVPDWLAPMLPSAYPGRSIEGGVNFTAPSGRTYRLVIARVALLGITWPGVTSLADLREVLEQNGDTADATVEAAAERFVVARIARPGDTPAMPARRRLVPDGELLAGMDVGNVRQQFCSDLDGGEVPQVPDDQPQADDVGPQMWWWPRSVRVEDDGSLTLIVDDDSGRLIRIPFTVNQGDLIYGTPQLVIETYVPVTSDPDENDGNTDEVTARGPRVLASWPIMAAARPSTTQEAQTMDIDAAVLRTRLGLPDDADEQAINEALTAAPAAGPVTAANAAVPDGMVVIDPDTLATLQAGAQTAQTLAARAATRDRDDIVTAAIQAGRIPAGARQRYVDRWDKDPEGTQTLLTASVEEGGLAPGLIPVQQRETGRGGDGEGDPQAGAQDHQQFMARFYPQEHARLSGQTGRTRIRQEA